MSARKHVGFILFLLSTLVVQAGRHTGDHRIQVRSGQHGQPAIAVKHTKSDVPYTHTIYFPLLQQDQLMTSRIGLVSLSDVAVSAQITCFALTGETVLDPLVVDLAAHGRWFDVVTDAPLADPIWCRVDATGPISGYLSMLAADQQRSVFVRATEQLEGLLYLPHIAESTQYWNTYTSLVHVEPTVTEDANPFFDYISGTVPLDGPIKPNTAFFMNWETDVFAGGFPEGMFFWGKLVTNITPSIDKSRATLAALELFEREGADIAQICGLDLGATTAKTLYFPHIANLQNGYWWTGVAIENVSTAPATVVFTPYDAAGTPMTPVTYEFEPSQKVVKLVEDFWEDMAQTLPGNTAWIRVDTEDGRLIGYELFGTLEAAGATVLTAVNATSTTSPNLLYPHVSENEQEWTGIVILNTGSEAATVTISARNNAGTLMGDALLPDPLAPNQKWVRLAADIFPGGLPEGTTQLVAEADQPLVGFELWGDDVEPEPGSNVTKNHLSGMLAGPAMPPVFRETFENILDIRYMDAGPYDGWMLVKFEDDDDGDFGWEHSTMIGYGDGSWYDEKWPQTIPQGRDYLVGFYGDSSALNHELLVSPVIDLPADVTTLTFDSQYGWAGYYTVTDRLFVTNDIDSAPAEILDAAVLVYEPGVALVTAMERSTQPELVADDFSQWHRVELDISAFAGSSIRLLFEINSLYEESWHIDKLEIR